MLYHLVRSTENYIIWTTNDDFTSGIYIGSWDNDLQEALSHPLREDSDPDDIDWVNHFGCGIILSSPTPITYSMLIENHPEILL